MVPCPEQQKRLHPNIAASTASGCNAIQHASQIWLTVLLFACLSATKNVGVQIGHDLLAAASSADLATSLVPVSERKVWLNIAAKLFSRTPDGTAVAARYKLLSQPFASL